MSWLYYGTSRIVKPKIDEYLSFQKIGTFLVYLCVQLFCGETQEMQFSDGDTMVSPIFLLSVIYDYQEVPNIATLLIIMSHL